MTALLPEEIQWLDDLSKDIVKLKLRTEAMDHAHNKLVDRIFVLEQETVGVKNSLLVIVDQINKEIRALLDAEATGRASSGIIAGAFALANIADALKNMSFTAPPIIGGANPFAGTMPAEATPEKTVEISSEDMFWAVHETANLYDSEQDRVKAMLDLLYGRKEWKQNPRAKQKASVPPIV